MSGQPGFVFSTTAGDAFAAPPDPSRSTFGGTLDACSFLPGKSLLRCWVTEAIASAVAELTLSVMRSISCRSNISLALLVAMSALFWWSTAMTETFPAKSLLAFMKSSAAISADLSAPGPEIAE